MQNEPSDDITIISPGTGAHKALKESALESKASSTPIYNLIAHAYNKAELDGFITIPGSVHSSNLKRVLENRGLANGEDYEIVRLTKDKEGRPLPKASKAVLLHKLSANLMRVI